MDSKKSGILSVLLHNKGTKITSLFLAVVTWYAIQSVINYEAVITDVPLTIRVDPGWAVLDSSVNTVDVRFRGSQEDIRYLSRDDVRVEADIRGQPFKSSYTVGLKLRDVKAPGAARAVSIQPGDITLRLDREGEKQVVVKADLQNIPSEDYEVESVVCTPASVILYGPQMRLNEIVSVSTAPIDLEGRSKSFRKQNLAVLPPSEAWTARIAPANVQVDVKMVERSATREFRDVPVGVMVQPGPRPRLEVQPASVTVVLKGRAELLNNLKENDVRAYADCAEMKAGATVELPVNVHLVPGLSTVSVDPPTVKVVIGEL